MVETTEQSKPTTNEEVGMETENIKNEDPSTTSAVASQQQPAGEEEVKSKSSKRGREDRRNPDASDTGVSAMRDEELIINTSEQIEIVTSFDQFGIPEQLLRGIYAYGFDKPSAVQQRAILPIIKGRDVIVQS